MRFAALALLIAGALGAQDFSEARIEKSAAGFRFVEGPVWSREGFLLVQQRHRITRSVRWFPASAPSCSATTRRGRLEIPMMRKVALYLRKPSARRVIRMDKKGKIEVLAEKWEGKRLNAPNDIVVRRDGHIYFTDPAFGEQSDTRELDFYGIYHINPKGIMEVAAKPKGRPNGIAFSPSGRILYVTNSTTTAWSATMWITTAQSRMSAWWCRRSPVCRTAFG